MNRSTRVERIVVIAVALLASVVSGVTTAQNPPPPPAGAQESASQELELVRQRRAAQKELNIQLRRRIEQPEQQLSAAGQGAALTQPALDRGAAKPVVENESEAANTALDQALHTAPTMAWAT